MLSLARALFATVAVVTVSLAALPAHADMGPIGTTKKIGAGVGGGSLAYGFSPKMYLTEDLAVQGAIGFSGWGMNIGVDGLKTMGTPIDIAAGLLWWGIGAGASAVLYRVGTYSATVVGGSVFGEVGWHF